MLLIVNVVCEMVLLKSAKNVFFSKNFDFLQYYAILFSTKNRQTVIVCLKKIIFFVQKY